MEEGEEEEGQEESWEVESGVQGEELAHMDGMWMTVSGVRTRLELEPNVSVMKCARNKTTCARSMELFVDVHVVKRHAIVDVLCRPVVNVVIGVHTVVFFVPIVLVHFVVLILLVVILYQFNQLFSRSHFSHMFSLYSHGILDVVFTHAQMVFTQSVCLNSVSQDLQHLKCWNSTIVAGVVGLGLCVWWCERHGTCRGRWHE